ncbi:SWI/SNF-related matrix-associated actin-dependent regulator of chromatin subfamily A-like protein 1 [Sesamum angolense]|uniref:SWI/SNF-related matrix-associated actin-dependent regulator of chromatin subfamily A-like protein 1 n=1 Tax=Sesamum angolense TaxID=2727404 RepID=A0AAE1W746_9LAMI|nr:SWI/SNF-related matrix-associated actin-dependent regulator of chromatin subfamily A-like protein 1 [Sesamum angolense]
MGFYDPTVAGYCTVRYIVPYYDMPTFHGGGVPELYGKCRGGFNIVPSNTRRPINLDGVFNIISYDTVPKLQDMLLASDFKGIFGVYQGASNHEELHNLIKATLMIRRLKKDVLSELPVKRRQQVFLELGQDEMRQINALFRELEVVKLKIKSCQSREEAESLKFTEKNLINKIYTDSAEAKVPAVLDYLGTIIEAGCKFLIFAHHQPMIDAIHKFLLKKKVGCIRIDGSTPAASRQALVTEFQEKDSVKAAVLSIKAGGVGLTLTAASTVIFAELSWTPGDIIQAEDRAHRIGQVSSVNIYYLLASDTVDDIIWDVIQSKLENLGQMLDGHENSLEVSVDQPGCSPLKQRTLDSFVKRCNNSHSDDEPKHKHPRN